jgi:hypothetical protein
MAGLSDAEELGQVCSCCWHNYSHIRSTQMSPRLGNSLLAFLQIHHPLRSKKPMTCAKDGKNTTDIIVFELSDILH